MSIRRRRAGWFALLLLLSGVLAAGWLLGGRSPEAAPVGDPVAPEPPPLSPELDSARSDEVSFERRIIEIDRFAREHPHDFREILGRWEELRAQAAGTQYEGYASMAAATARAAWAHAASEARLDLAAKVALAVDEWRWDEATSWIETFPASLRGVAEVDERLVGLVAFVERERARWEGGHVYAHADFRSGAEDFPRSEGLRIELHEVAHRVEPGRAARLAFYSAGESRARIVFPIDAPPRRARLRLRHVASMIDDERCYSPVTVVLNGEVLAANWNPANRTWVSSGIWDVSALLTPGENELVIRFGDGYSQYWLEAFEVSGLR